MARSGSGRRGMIAALTVVVVALGVALLARVGFGSLTDRLRTECDFGDYRTSTSQAAVAAEMTAVVVKRGLPERAAVLTLAAAMQESKLRNIPAGQGDRDSVGVLQQRPSQGWGTEVQLSDITFATGAFLDALVKVPNWQADTLAEVIQRVQISADGGAYAKHGDQAQVMADALTGARQRGVTCQFRTPDQVADAAQVAEQVSQALPVNAPSTSDRTITVPGARWATAAWMVANGDRFGLETVSYAGGTWSRTDGWRDANSGSGAVVAVLHG